MKVTRKRKKRRTKWKRKTKWKRSMQLQEMSLAVIKKSSKNGGPALVVLSKVL